MSKAISDYLIAHEKFQEYSGKAIDWFIKSLKYKHGTDEWQICRLKRQIYMRKALKYLK